MRRTSPTRRQWRRIAAATTLALTLAGCSDDDGKPTEPRITPTATIAVAAARPTSTARIEVMSPESGATVATGTVQVVITLTGGRILPAVSRNLTADTGHMHVKLDGVVITAMGGLKLSVPNVGPGPHLLEVEFSAADHGSFRPPVVVAVPFTAR